MGGPHHVVVVSSWDLGKMFSLNHQQKKMCINIFWTVFSANMSYHVLSVALLLKRKINLKAWACSGGIWDGSSTEANHSTLHIFPKFSFSFSLSSEWICHSNKVFQPGKYWFSSPLLWLPDLAVGQTWGRGVGAPTLTLAFGATDPVDTSKV